MTKAYNAKSNLVSQMATWDILTEIDRKDAFMLMRQVNWQGSLDLYLVTQADHLRLITGRYVVYLTKPKTFVRPQGW